MNSSLTIGTGLSMENLLTHLEQHNLLNKPIQMKLSKSYSGSSNGMDATLTGLKIEYQKE